MPSASGLSRQFVSQVQLQTAVNLYHPRDPFVVFGWGGRTMGTPAVNKEHDV